MEADMQKTLWNRGQCLPALCVFTLLGLSPGFAQTDRCDWSVVGIAGGEMVSSEYRCVATAGQSVAGFMTSPDYWALVGFWVPEGRAGIEEGNKGSRDRVLATRLYSPFPTPFSRSVAIRYTLDAERP